MKSQQEQKRVADFAKDNNEENEDSMSDDESASGMQLRVAPPPLSAARKSSADSKSAAAKASSSDGSCGDRPTSTSEAEDGQNKLPIDAYREDILRRVSRDRVTIIHGETGCGKSSRLPLILLENAEEKGELCRMMVSQPRRIAASSLMRRLRGLVGNKVR
jgi:HrpA-like RNA helicase